MARPNILHTIRAEPPPFIRYRNSVKTSFFDVVEGSYNNAMHVVLYEPDIPWNTGNVGRTCVATGSTLHLVGKLGFSLDAAQVKRAGLDYWEKVRLFQYPSWEAFIEKIPVDAPLY